MKDKNILVTGGAGFIGSHLIDLLSKNNKVLIIDNFSSGRIENISQHIGKRVVKIVNTDIRNKKKIFELAKGIDIIYHLAASCLRVSIYDPEMSHQVNATGTLNLCMAALKNKVKKFIYVSSSEVYGSAKYSPMDEEHPLEPMTVYAASKLVGEYYCNSFYRTYGLPVIIVRPFNTYGPREHFEGPYGEIIPRFVIRVLNGMPPVIFGDGNQMKDFTYVTEVAYGILKASECDGLIGDVVNIAYGRGVSVRDIARLIIDMEDKSGLKINYKTKRPADVNKHCADISKAKRMFKFNPRIDIKTGIEKYIKWLKAQNLDLKMYIKECGSYNWLKQPKNLRLKLLFNSSKAI